MSKFSVDMAFRAIDKVTPTVKKMEGGVKGFANSAESSMMRAQLKMRSFASASGRALKKVMRFGAVAAGAFVAVGFSVFKLANQTATLGDEIGKTSRQIGISSDYLQEMRFIAERQGVTSETLTGAFQMLNKNVGEFQGGQGRLLTYLNRVNPALAGQLKQVESNEEAFDLAVKAIKAMPNVLQRTAMAEKFFGGQGREMLKIIEASPEALSEMRAELHRLGGVLDKDAIAASEKFKDSQENLKRALGGLKATIGAELLPVVMDVMKQVTEWVAANKELLKVKIVAFVQKLSDGLKWVFSNMGKLQAIMKIVIGVMGVWLAVQLALNVAMLMNPVGLTVLAVIALIAALVLLVKNWEKVKQHFIDKLKEIELYFKVVWAKIGLLMESVWRSAKSSFASFLDFIWEGLTSIGKFLFDVLITPLKWILSAASAIGIDIAGDALKGLGAIEAELFGGANQGEVATRESVFQQQMIQAQPSTVGININNNNGSDVSVEDNYFPVKVVNNSFF